jgi:phospholipase/lecithinase/hemolysin
MPQLSIPEAMGLATWSFGMVMTRSSSLTQVANLIAQIEAEPYNPPKVRAANGPVWADILPQNLGLKPQQVNNFAYIGSTTGIDPQTGFQNGIQPFLPQSFANTKLPGLPSQFFWYDYQHPTTKVHQVLADFFKDNIFTSGSSNKLWQTIGSQISDLKTSPVLAGELARGISDLKSLGLNQDLLLGLLPDRGALPVEFGVNTSVKL